MNHRYQKNKPPKSGRISLPIWNRIEDKIENKSLVEEVEQFLFPSLPDSRSEPGAEPTSIT